MHPLPHCATFTAATTALAVVAGLARPTGDDNPPEFGAVAWGDRLEDAQRAAASSKKPILLLFQEVPG